MHLYLYTCIHSLIIIKFVFTIFRHFYLYIHSLTIITLLFMIFVRHPHRLSTKCPRDETAVDEVYPWRNGWQRSVPETKCLETKCTHDKTSGDEVSLRRNGRRRNGGDKTAATKWRRRKGVYPFLKTHFQIEPISRYSLHYSPPDTYRSYMLTWLLPENIAFCVGD